MSGHFLYLTTTGRTSGLPRHIEIWFVVRAGRYYMVSQGRERSNWVQNITKNPRVSFSIGTRDEQTAGHALTSATARIVSPENDPELVRQVTALMDEKYDWSNGLLVELNPELPHEPQ